MGLCVLGFVLLLVLFLWKCDKFMCFFFLFPHLFAIHFFLFSYGYLTWEWKNGLRGYLYPFVFACLYKILSIFGLDNRILLVTFYWSKFCNGFYFMQIVRSYEIYMYVISFRLLLYFECKATQKHCSRSFMLNSHIS